MYLAPADNPGSRFRCLGRVFVRIRVLPRVGTVLPEEGPGADPAGSESGEGFLGPDPREYKESTGDRPPLSGRATTVVARCM